MIDPTRYAKEHLELWSTSPANPLTEQEKEVIQGAIAALDAVSQTIFAEDEPLLVEPCQIFLKTLLEGDRP